MPGLLGAAALTASASASILIIPSPGNFPGDENILFNQPGLLASGPVVQGKSHMTHFTVDYYDAGEDLTTPPGGQARVVAVDDRFTTLTVSLNDPQATFQTYIWNLNAVAPGNVTFTVERTGGADHVESFAMGEAGENWFRFQAQDDAMISIRFNADVDIAEVKQNRMGGMNVVPEPATMGALAIGALALLRRRKK